MSGLFFINKKIKGAPNNKVSRFPKKINHTVLHPSPASSPNLTAPAAIAASSCNCCSSTGNVDGESSDAKTSTKASLGSLRGGIKWGINFLEVIWLVVGPTHLKILVKLEVFPNFRGENKKYLSNHQLVLSCVVPWSQGFLYSRSYLHQKHQKEMQRKMLSSPENLRNEIDAATLETATLPKYPNAWSLSKCLKINALQQKSPQNRWCTSVFQLTVTRLKRFEEPLQKSFQNKSHSFGLAKEHRHPQREATTNTMLAMFATKSSESTPPGFPKRGFSGCFG